MAAERLRLLGRCVCLVILMSASVSPTQDYADLVARLYRQAVRDNKPLVVVLDQKRLKGQADLSSSSSDENVNVLGKLVKQLQQRLRVKPVSHDHGQYHNYEKLPKSRNHRFRSLLHKFADKRDRYQVQPPRYQVPKYHEQRYRNENNIFGPKNVVKSLLSLRNSLSCNALDQCKRRCRSYALRQKDSCQYKCEITFTCEQQQKDDDCTKSDNCEPEDSCAEGDECGDEELNPSTRAPPEYAL